MCLRYLFRYLLGTKLVLPRYYFGRRGSAIHTSTSTGSTIVPSQLMIVMDCVFLAVVGLLHTNSSRHIILQCYAYAHHQHHIFISAVPNDPIKCIAHIAAMQPTNFMDELPPPQPGAADQDAARLLYHFYRSGQGQSLLPGSCLLGSELYFVAGRFIDELRSACTCNLFSMVCNAMCRLVLYCPLFARPRMIVP